jgi:hypothetical protein
MSAKSKAAMPYGWGRVSYTYRDRLPWMNLPFPVEEYHERLDRIRGRMGQDGLDCLVAVGSRADNGNIRYLSNFEDFYGGDTIVIIPASGPPGFTTNAVMHGEPMHSGIQDCWIEDVRCAAAPRTVTGSASPATIHDHVEDFISERGCAESTIGVEGEIGTEALGAFLSSTFPKAKVTLARGLLRSMRAIKSLREVEALRRAAHLADAGMKAAMDAVGPGLSEFELAAEANYAMFKAGAEHPAFAIGLTAGQRSGFKHMAPTGYRVREGDMARSSAIWRRSGSRSRRRRDTNSTCTSAGTASAPRCRTCRRSRPATRPPCRRIPSQRRADAAGGVHRRRPRYPPRPQVTERGEVGDRVPGDGHGYGRARGAHDGGH